MSNEVMDLVQIENSQPVTTSLIVAEKFEREHNDVVRTIRKLVSKDVGKISEMFCESFYTDKYGRKQPSFFMNRDGFSLLVMGFTGDKALKFKLKFIEAFNKMEQQLKYGSEKPPMDYLEALEQLVAKEKQLRSETQRANNAEIEAKKNQDARDLQDQATERRIGYDMGKASKFLNVEGLGRNKLFKFLRDVGVFFYDLSGYNSVKQCHINQKRFNEYLDETYEYPVIYITPKGMRFVLKELVNNGYKPKITAEEWERKCQQMSDEVDYDE